VLEEFGMAFRRDKEGRRTPIPFPLGGHSVERSLVTLAEGNQIGNALRGALYGTGVRLYEEYLVTDLFTEQGQVNGALGVDLHTGEFLAWSAKRVILASGGCGSLFAPFTSNMRSNTGDGFVLAFEAGAELRDMEQAQFIFGISHPESRIGVLCGEPASAGFFGRLLDSEGKEIIDRPGKKTRGQVSAAMAKAISSKKVGPFGGVFLDLSGNVHRLGPVYRKVLSLSRKSALEAIRFAYGNREANCEAPWEVVASFHYLPGGVKVDGNCQATVKNLYAVGQVQGGLFGADRLGSVSLTELFVFGKIAAASAVRELHGADQPRLDKKAVERKIQEKVKARGTTDGVRPVELKRRLQKLMWQNVGPVRNRNSLEQALQEIDVLDNEKNNVRVPLYKNYNTDWIDLLELNNMICLGRIIARCALERAESRGGHVRMDYPHKDDANWLATVVAIKEREKLAIRSDPMKHAWENVEPSGLVERLPSMVQDILVRRLPRTLVRRILRKKLGDFVEED
jgi:fumarate reductase (CoM/CoB) subunit A